MGSSDGNAPPPLWYHGSPIRTEAGEEKAEKKYGEGVEGVRA